MPTRREVRMRKQSSGTELCEEPQKFIKDPALSQDVGAEKQEFMGGDNVNFQERAQYGSEANAPIFQKTKMCKFHLLGICAKGSACVFAHHRDELNQLPDFYRTKLCKTLINKGQCRDRQCTYAHNKDELRTAPVLRGSKVCKFFEAGHCELGARCGYAHSLPGDGSQAKMSVSAEPRQMTSARVSTTGADEDDFKEVVVLDAQTHQPLYRGHVQVGNQQPPQQQKGGKAKGKGKGFKGQAEPLPEESPQQQYAYYVQPGYMPGWGFPAHPASAMAIPWGYNVAYGAPGMGFAYQPCAYVAASPAEALGQLENQNGCLAVADEPAQMPSQSANGQRKPHSPIRVVTSTERLDMLDEKLDETTSTGSGSLPSSFLDADANVKTLPSGVTVEETSDAWVVRNTFLNFEEPRSYPMRPIASCAGRFEGLSSMSSEDNLKDLDFVM